MTIFRSLGVLTATSLLALMLSAPVYANGFSGGNVGSDASQGDTGKGDTGTGDTGKGDTGKGDTGTGTGDTGKGDTGKGDTGKGDTGKGDTGKGDTGDKGKDPDPTPDPTPQEPGDRSKDQETKKPGDKYTKKVPGKKVAVCDTNKRSLLSNEGTFVGNITGINCRHDGSVLYHVHLAKGFNDEARRFILKTHVRPVYGKNVRLQLTDMEIKKLIWMNARH
jgi:hypothetical protein